MLHWAKKFTTLSIHQHMNFYANCIVISVVLISCCLIVQISNTTPFNRDISKFGKNFISTQKFVQQLTTFTKQSRTNQSYILPTNISRLLPNRIRHRFILDLIERDCLFDAITQKYQRNTKLNKNKRTVLWTCKGGCGGVGDRSKGLITAFLHSVGIGYNFHILWNTPSQLYPGILTPGNTINWALRAPSVRDTLELSLMDRPKNSSFKACSWLNYSRIALRTNSISIPDATNDCEKNNPAVLEILKQQVLTKTCFKDTKDTSHWNLQCMGCMWWYLFRIGKRLEYGLRQEYLQFIAWKQARNLTSAVSISLHMRSGDSNMRAGHGRETDLNALLTRMEKCTFKIKSEIQGQSFLVLASDSYLVRRRVLAWNWTSVYTPGSIPFHVDKTRVLNQDQGMHGTVAVFVDLFMISLQDFLLLSGTSGYGYLARSIGRYDDKNVVQCA